MLYLIVVPMAATGFSAILLPVAIMGSLGLIFGLILAFASKVFPVTVDDRIEKIIKVLPGANCGACGQPGCSGYATAIVNEGKDLNLCAPGGPAVVEKIAQIMGKEATAIDKKLP